MKSIICDIYNTHTLIDTITEQTEPTDVTYRIVLDLPNTNSLLKSKPKQANIGLQSS